MMNGPIQIYRCDGQSRQRYSQCQWITAVYHQTMKMTEVVNLKQLEDSYAPHRSTFCWQMLVGMRWRSGSHGQKKLTSPLSETDSSCFWILLELYIQNCCNNQLCRFIPSMKKKS
ncbi:uncharacterized protein LOC121783563 [Salvia splendens]|uniref:uncharacterized protein LOC121783563 n=1 Tax=Salvia splendens TaxID=180675 RepID=UPI001C26667C|nr:uncharacterized protein LOC121783563 [Salvia splendens]XP_042037608.1 uncharacterized protein LOC121783563 [Salvia splendens]